MVAPIQSLANMEYRLYGNIGYGLSSGAPSIVNNYSMQNPYAMYGYNYGAANAYNPTFGQNIPSTYSSQSSQQQTSNSAFTGLSDSETNALINSYVEAPSESLLGAAWGGVTFGLMNNPRFVAHPINTFKAFKGVDSMFKSVLTEGSKLNELWVNPKTNSIMRDAYCEMQRAFARGESRLPIFRNKFSAEEVNKLKEIMEKALSSGKPEEIAKATEILKSAYTTDTWFGKLFKPLLKLGGFDTPYKTVEEAIEASKTVEGGKLIQTKATEALEKAGKTSFGQALKSHAGIGGVLLFAGIEFAMGIGNIKTAYAKDRENEQNGQKTHYGRKQLLQTTIKGLGSGLGWGIGEGVGTWAFAKWGMKLGSKFHPVIGTIIGGVAGLVGGSIGMMLTGKLTHALVGTDVAETIKAQDMAKSTEGQVQLLQHTMEKMQKGEKVDPQAQAAVQKLISQYSAAA